MFLKCATISRGENPTNVFEREVLMTERTADTMEGDIVDGGLHRLSQTSLAQEGTATRRLLKERTGIAADIAHTSV